MSLRWRSFIIAMILVVLMNSVGCFAGELMPMEISTAELRQTEISDDLIDTLPVFTFESNPEEATGEVEVEVEMTPETTVVQDSTSNTETVAPETTAELETQVLPETTAASETTAIPVMTTVPETTAIPETIVTPETTVIPETTPVTERQEQTVYWVEGGEVWHTTSSCPSLSRSKNILSGSLDDAIAAGKERVCKRCG